MFSLFLRGVVKVRFWAYIGRDFGRLWAQLVIHGPTFGGKRDQQKTWKDEPCEIHASVKKGCAVQPLNLFLNNQQPSQDQVLDEILGSQDQVLDQVLGFRQALITLTR